MKFRSGRPPEQKENMLPLINVVFLLLIFFMLLANISTHVPFPVTLPAAERTEDGRPDIMVAVAADGRVALDGNEIETAALDVRIRPHLSQPGRPTVWLYADRDADSDRVLDVMEHLRKAGATTLRLVTER